VKIDLFLNHGQINDTLLAYAFTVVGIIDPLRLHDLAYALNNASHAGVTDKHVMALRREHESSRSGQRIEPGIGQ